MQSRHMTDSETHERFRQRTPEVDTAARNERSGGRDGWMLFSGQSGQSGQAGQAGQEGEGSPTQPTVDMADIADIADMTESQSLIATRRNTPVKNGELDGSPTQDFLAHVSDADLAGFRFACAEAARAEHEIGNPLVGFKHYRAALHSFPFLPGLDVLRDKLIASAINVLEMSLQSADECLKDRRTWAAARAALERASNLLETEDALHVAFAVRYELLHSLYLRLTNLLPAGRRNLAQPAEHDLLRDLRDEMVDDPQSYWHMPGWRRVRERLERLDAVFRREQQDEWFAARRQFVADVHHAYNDASAGEFLERHVQHGNPPPLDEDIAQLQLEEAAALLARADQLMHAHGADASALLHNELDKLEAWQRDLRALIGGLNVARRRATLGLREPEQLDVARYVLGVGGRKPATPLRQTPQMFVGHPSLLCCKAFVDHCAARRKSQERLLREITLCLRFDAATTPEDILTHEADDFTPTLRSRLQPGAACTYPVEVAWDKLREMARGEPDDACGLQKALVYSDSDDHGREIVSLPSIATVVGRKVHQIRVLHDWLPRFTPDATRSSLDFPGVVDWEGEKSAIETLRDSGPAGLTEAQVRCCAAKSGDHAGMVQGVWSLARMCQALSQESMMAHLRRTLSEDDLDAANMPLCAAAQVINHQRYDLWRTYQRQLHECDPLAADIARRIDGYAAAWDAFEYSYRALMALSPLRPLRRGRIAESVEWQGFQRAAERFYGICPNYGVFQSKLGDVQARFKLQPECLDGRRA